MGGPSFLLTFRNFWSTAPGQCSQQDKKHPASEKWSRPSCSWNLLELQSPDGEERAGGGPKQTENPKLIQLFFLFFYNFRKNYADHHTIRNFK